MKLFKFSVKSKMIGNVNKYVTYAGKQSIVNEYIHSQVKSLLNEEINRISNVVSISSNSQKCKSAIIDELLENVKFLDEFKQDFIACGHMHDESLGIKIDCAPIDENDHIHLN